MRSSTRPKQWLAQIGPGQPPVRRLTNTRIAPLRFSLPSIPKQRYPSKGFIGGKKRMVRHSLRQVMTGLLVVMLWLASGWGLTAEALTPIDLEDVHYEPCPAEYAEGMVTAGSIQEANCFLILGKAINRSGKPVRDVDIFGRVFDANDNPVMQNRGRLGGIEEVLPGESEFEIRISVAANQPEPLQLRQFKASGFASMVR